MGNNKIANKFRLLLRDPLFEFGTGPKLYHLGFLPPSFFLIYLVRSSPALSRKKRSAYCCIKSTCQKTYPNEHAYVSILSLGTNSI